MAFLSFILFLDIYSHFVCTGSIFVNIWLLVTVRSLLVSNVVLIHLLYTENPTAEDGSQDSRTPPSFSTIVGPYKSYQQSFSKCNQPTATSVYLLFSL